MKSITSNNSITESIQIKKPKESIKFFMQTHIKKTPLHHHNQKIFQSNKRSRNSQNTTEHSIQKPIQNQKKTRPKIPKFLILHTPIVYDSTWLFLKSFSSPITCVLDGSVYARIWECSKRMKNCRLVEGMPAQG